jgi:hypothetical protein
MSLKVNSVLTPIPSSFEVDGLKRVFERVNNLTVQPVDMQILEDRYLD